MTHDASKVMRETMTIKIKPTSNSIPYADFTKHLIYVTENKKNTSTIKTKSFDLIN
jgi:sorbitol-specific phosphotransferase system component IIBC